MFIKQVQYNIYRPAYFIYVFVSLAIIAIALFLIKTYVKKNKQLDTLIFVLAIVWLILGIGNRISETCDMMLIYHKSNYRWINILPFTFCSLSSIATPITLLINKKEGNTLHCLIYFCLLGAVITYVYPDWMLEQPFYDASNIFGWLHHSMMLFMALLLLITKRFIPSVKKFYIMPLGYALTIIYGLFLITALKFDNAFAIVKPLQSGSTCIEVITSWYGILIIGSILLVVFLFVYVKIFNKINTKEFFLQLLRIHK